MPRRKNHSVTPRSQSVSTGVEDNASEPEDNGPRKRVRWGTDVVPPEKPGEDEDEDEEEGQGESSSNGSGEKVMLPADVPVCEEH